MCLHNFMIYSWRSSDPTLFLMIALCRLSTCCQPINRTGQPAWPSPLTCLPYLIALCISFEHKYHIFCYLLQAFACACIWVSSNHNLKSTLAMAPCKLLFHVLYSGKTILIWSFLLEKLNLGPKTSGLPFDLSQLTAFA